VKKEKNFTRGTMMDGGANLTTLKPPSHRRSLLSPWLVDPRNPKKDPEANISTSKATLLSFLHTNPQILKIRR
jgi:hypothetical protein